MSVRKTLDEGEREKDNNKRERKTRFFFPAINSVVVGEGQVVLVKLTRVSRMRNECFELFLIGK